MIPVTKAKHTILDNYKWKPFEKYLDHSMICKRRVQQTAQWCVNGYWLGTCSSIHRAPDKGNIRSLHHGIKKALGPTQGKAAALRSEYGETFQDWRRQMEIWVEHYSELYCKGNKVSEAVFNTVHPLLCYIKLRCRKVTDDPSLDKIPDKWNSTRRNKVCKRHTGKRSL